MRESTEPSERPSRELSGNGASDRRRETQLGRLTHVVPRLKLRARSWGDEAFEQLHDQGTHGEAETTDEFTMGDRYAHENPSPGGSSDYGASIGRSAPGARSRGSLWSRVAQHPALQAGAPQLIIGNSVFAGANEQFQVLLSQLEKWIADSNRRVFLIASAVRNEGKSFVALNLAAAWATPRTPVLLVDGDLRTPSLHQLFSAGPNRDLASYLEGNCDLVECFQKTPIAGLAFVPGRRFQGSIIQAFADSRMRDFIGFARSIEPPQRVLIDSPATLAAPEVRILAGMVDAVLLVVAANMTARQLIPRALESLKEAPLFGVILNRFEPPLSTLKAGRAAPRQDAGRGFTES